MFCNFSSGYNFRNINHRKHVTDNCILHLERTSFSTEPYIGMRIQRLELKRIFPDTLFIKSLLQRFNYFFRHAALRHVLKRLSNHILPVNNKVIRQLLGHVLDLAVLIKDDKNRITRRKHDRIENRVFLDTACFIRDQEQIADRSIIFDKELEYDFPPGVFASTALDRNNNLPFAGMHFTAFRDFIYKLLELFRTEKFPEDFATDIVAVIEKFCNVGTRMQNIKCIIGQDNSKIVAP